MTAIKASGQPSSRAIMFFHKRTIHSPECVHSQANGGAPLPSGTSRREGCRGLPGYVPLLMVVLFILIYGAIVRRFGWPDVLERKVIDDPSVHNFDGWAGAHFIFWAFMGFLIPDRYVSALGISLLWEGIEDNLGRHKIMVGGKRLQLVGATEEDGDIQEDDEAFWYGRYVTDTFFNLAGYILGSAAAQRFWSETTCAI